MGVKRSWGDVVRLHEEAVTEFAAAARSVPAEAWLVPRAPGKWSPAEITQHLILAFEAVRRELTEGVPMALRTRWYHRLVLRFTYQRRLMQRGKFPSGARAPRESRPQHVSEDAETLVVRFEARAAELLTLAENARGRKPPATLLHPYFGRIPLDEAMFISARHIDHHRAQVADTKKPGNVPVAGPS